LELLPCFVICGYLRIRHTIKKAVAESKKDIDDKDVHDIDDSQSDSEKGGVRINIKNSIVRNSNIGGGKRNYKSFWGHAGMSSSFMISGTSKPSKLRMKRPTSHGITERQRFPKNILL
jgi:hypothetical protein